MLKDRVTIQQAAERWVQGFMNQFPVNMIEKLIECDLDSWNEITFPRAGDRAYVYRCSELGRVKGKSGDAYIVKLDTGGTVELSLDDFCVERDSLLPMWGTMWQFRDSVDDYWLENMGGVQALTNCGFRVYESYEFGYFFGIDGAGYDFYESHWIPLYKARRLQWHDPILEQEAKP